ncbi:orotate phosphoribosyltransferase [Halobaculum halobium]
MTDVDGLCEGRLLDTGERYREDRSFRDLDSVLVIDDSVRSGAQMTKTRNRLEELDLPFDVSYAAVYVSREGHRYVDYWGEIVPRPRVFEWNLMHHPLLQNSCVDIDGVLCRDPTPEENDDGERYREFLTEVEPNIVPNQQIGHLVTSRLETYRTETEEWLDEHGFQYDRLVMMDLPSKEARQAQGNHAQHKANVYDSTDAPLFIESSQRQSSEICQRTSRPVFCYGTNEMIRPGRAKRTYQQSRSYVSRLRENPATFSVKAAKHLFFLTHNFISARIQ